MFIIMQEVARRAAAQQRQQMPTRRREVEAQQAAMHTGAPGCPCGCCSQEEAVEHVGGTMLLAAADPQEAVCHPIHPLILLYPQRVGHAMLPCRFRMMSLLL
jgi:hypothetical protein